MGMGVRRWLHLIGVVQALLFSPGFAARQEAGFLDRSLALDGVQHRYQVYVPYGYPGEVRWPVILFLHGAGERGTDGLLPTEIGLGPRLRRSPERFPAIVVFPQCPPEMRWTGPAGEAAMVALARTLAEFRTDTTRVYLVGISMGGTGVWRLAYAHPHRFAALVPICGRVEGPNGMGSILHDPSTLHRRLAERVRHLPIWMFHGETDDVVPVAESRRMAQELESLGAQVRYTELPGIGHGAWDPALGSPRLTGWLFRQRTRP